MVCSLEPSVFLRPSLDELSASQPSATNLPLSQHGADELPSSHSGATEFTPSQPGASDSQHLSLRRLPSFFHPTLETPSSFRLRLLSPIFLRLSETEVKLIHCLLTMLLCRRREILLF